MRYLIAFAALVLLPAAGTAQGLDLEYNPRFRLRLPEPGGFPQAPPTYFTQQPQAMPYANGGYARPYVQEGAPFAAPSGGCAGGGGPVYLGSFDVDQRGQYLGGTGLGPQLFGLMFAQQQGYGAPSPVPTSTYAAPQYTMPYANGGNGNGFRAYQSPYQGGYTNGGFGGGYAAPQTYGAPAGGGGRYVYCPPGVQ